MHRDMEMPNLDAGGMPIMGIDFSSSPGPRKPLMCVSGCLRDDHLIVEGASAMEDFTAFAALLDRPGPWVAGIDFPFGQPRRLLDNLGWAADWPSLVQRVEELGPGGFTDLLDAYRAPRPPGDKQHLRATDALAGALSPMMVHGIPVGRMFARGAPLLMHCPASIPACRPRDDDRILLETYPGLAARRLIGRKPYKTEQRSRDAPARRSARAALVEAIRDGGLRQGYDLHVDLPDELAERCLSDFKGDLVDALLCAVQAAWAWNHRAENFGIPASAQPAEGWICDPLLHADTSAGSVRPAGI